MTKGQVSALAAALLGASLALSPIGSAPAKAFGVDKRLCDNSANAANPANFGSAWCSVAPNAANPPITNIQPYVPYTYVVKLDGLSSGQSQTINEDFPIEFSRIDVACYQVIGGVASSVTVSSLSPASPVPAPAPGPSLPQSWTVGPTSGGFSDDVLCLVKGFFMNPYASSAAPTIDADNWVTVGSQQKDWNGDIANTSPTLDIKKTILSPAGDLLIPTGGPAVIKYQIVISSAAEYYFGNYVELIDSFSLTPDSVPLAVKYIAGSATCVPTGAGTDCFAPTPAIGANGNPIALIDPGYVEHLTWRFPSGSLGHIAAGGTITLTFEVEVSTTCFTHIRTLDGNGLLNRALLDEVGSANPPLAPVSTDNIVKIGIDTGTTLLDPTYCLNVNPTAPPGVIDVTKAQVNPASGTAANWTTGSTSATYTIRVTNNDVATAPPVLNISLTDIVQELPGTPPFDTRVASVSCTSSQAGLCGTFPTSGAQQSLIGYFDQKLVWSYTIPSLAPGQWVEFNVRIGYRQDNCISATNLRPLLIRNFAIVNYVKDVVLSDGTPYSNYPYSDVSYVDTRMSDPPDCTFGVRKKFQNRTYLGSPNTSNKIVFDTALGAFTNSITYRLNFHNTGSIPRRIGTLIDSISLEQQNYAASLNFAYQFTCHDNNSSGSSTGVLNYLASGNGTTATLYAASPANGARISFKGSGLWVTFPANSQLTCDVTLAVERPPVNNPYCLSNVQPTLVDLALMDVSALYPANVTWPPSSQSNWDLTKSNLPKCYNILVNKTANPAHIAPGVTASSVLYTVKIEDLEHPNSGFGGFSGTSSNWDGPVLTDMFRFDPVTATNVPGGLPGSASLVTDPCAQASAPCDWFTEVPGTQPARLRIKNFVNDSPPDGQLTFQYKVNGPFNPDLIINDIAVTMSGTAVEDWYPRNPNTNPNNIAACAVPNLAACATANVSVTGTLNIFKEIDHGSTPVVLNPNIQFPVTVHCERTNVAGLPDKLFNANATVTAGATPASVFGIWVESDCKVTETPDPAALPADCKWNTPVVQYPSGNSIHIGQDPTPYAVTIVNSYTCPPPVDVSIVKSADDYSVVVGNTVAFTLAVTNDGPNAIVSPTVVNVSDPLPSGFTPVFASSNADWDCSAYPPTCTYIGGPLAPGQSALPITIVAQATAPGAWENCATVGVSGATQAAGGGVKSCVTVLVGEPPNPCCEEECLFEIPFFGDHHLCVTWHILCCILTLILLFLILQVLWLILVRGSFRK